MRILMLSDVYFPRINGVSTSIQSLTHQLTGLGHDVEIVAPEYLQDYEDHHRVTRVPARTLFFDPEDRLMKRTPLRRLRRELEARPPERRFDLVHIHTPFMAHLEGVKLAAHLGIPAVETYHTFFEEYVAHYLPWLPAGWTRRFARWYSRRLCNDVDHLVIPTEQMRPVLDRYRISTPTTVVPSGIDFDHFHGGNGASFRERHGIPLDRPTVVTVSRVAREKNIDFLLRTVDQVRQHLPNVLFIIAGEGPDEARLKRLTRELRLEDNVLFVGNLERSSTLLDCYRAGDAFVFASPTETQGLVLIEALALGVPVVSTAVMGTATVLAGTKGALICAEDEAPFAASVLSVLKDDVLRSRLAEGALQDARAWCSTRLAQQMVDLYRSLASEAPRIAA